MAKLRHLRSSVAGRRPLPQDLLPGQLFINRTDKSLSFLDANNQVVDFGAYNGAVGVLFTTWCRSREGIWSGFAPSDGQILLRADFPDAWAAIENGSAPSTTDADWIATPSKRGMFSTGDDTTTFRMPDDNGKVSGSLGSVFLGGDGPNSAGIAGTIQQDAMQRITGNLAFHGSASDGSVFAGGTGAFTNSTPVPNAQLGTPIGGSSSSFNAQLDTALNTRTATRTRPLNVTGCWVIKLFGEVVNPGTVDIAAMAAELELLRNPPWLLLGKSTPTSLPVGNSALPVLQVESAAFINVVANGYVVEAAGIYEVSVNYYLTMIASSAVECLVAVNDIPTRFGRAFNPTGTGNEDQVNSTIQLSLSANAVLKFWTNNTTAGNQLTTARICIRKIRELPSAL